MQKVVNEAHGDEGVVRHPQVANEDGTQQEHCGEQEKTRRVFDAQIELDRLVVGVFLCQGMVPPYEDEWIIQPVILIQPLQFLHELD